MNGVVPDSDALSFSTAGTYYWQAVYSGDGKNNGATSTCTSEKLTVTSAGALGAWSDGASMSVERVWDTQTVLSDGRILVAGGQTNAGVYTNTAELYDPTSGSWSSAGAMAHGRYLAAAARLGNGRVLVAGGDRAGNCGAAIGTADIYDPATNAWSSAAPLQTPRLAASAVAFADGRVLVAGGTQPNPDCNTSTIFSTVEIYDPASNSWSTAAPMNAARYLALATLLPDGRVLIAGGWGGPSGPYHQLNSAEIYNPITDTWATVAPMTWGHAFGTLTRLADGRVLVVGGTSSGSGIGAVFAGAEVYDPTQNSWITTGPMVANREDQTAALLAGGDVLVAGGLSSSFFRLASAERYNPGTNHWTATADMPRATNDALASPLPNGDLLVTGGQSDTGIENRTEIFDPTASPCDPATEIC
jgi:N-acetylneuraminic acid mutarotase